MKQSCLQMIPIVGSQLAMQFSKTGSVKGFQDSPAFGSLLADMGISISKIVYGAREFPSLDQKREVSFLEKEYFSKPEPTVEETSAYMKQRFLENDTMSTVRIPVRTKNGSCRYHDGTFISTSRDLSKQTVLLYHGNAQHRNDQLESAQIYLDKGCAVVLMSYAGDHVIAGKGDGYGDSSTKCSELAMREDAQADVAFLKSLGVRHVGVHGYSLGGAQGLNFAQAIGKDNDMAMDFVVLDRTFTTVEDVVQNVVQSKVPSTVLGRCAADYVKANILTEVSESWKYGCDALNNEAKLQEIGQYSNFSETQFVFLGASDDELMSRKVVRGEDSRRNFASDLANTVPFEIQKRTTLDLQEDQDHCSSLDYSLVKTFLFPDANNL